MSELADRIAARVRDWYEEHREHWTSRMGEHDVPDKFMLALVAEVERVVHEMTPHVPPPQPLPLPPAPIHPEPHKKKGRK